MNRLIAYCARVNERSSVSGGLEEVDGSSGEGNRRHLSWGSDTPRLHCNPQAPSPVYCVQARPSFSARTRRTKLMNVRTRLLGGCVQTTRPHRASGSFGIRLHDHVMSPVGGICAMTSGDMASYRQHTFRGLVAKKEEHHGPSEKDRS